MIQKILAIFVVILINGGAIAFIFDFDWFCESFLPVIRAISTFTLLFFLFIPFAFFKKTKNFVNILFTSQMFICGYYCVFSCCAIVKILMGTFWVIVGALFLGFGVIPLSLFASATKGNWNAFIDTILFLCLALIPSLTFSFFNKKTE